LGVLGHPDVLVGESITRQVGGQVRQHFIHLHYRWSDVSIPSRTKEE
jgi:hypothetical protein